MEKALAEAIIYAIKGMGLAEFKKTSFFLRNHRHG